MFTNSVVLPEKLELPSETAAFCRLCLAKDNLLALGSAGKVNTTADDVAGNSTTQLIQLIYECTNVKLSLTDEPGCTICECCQRALVEFYRFRSQAKRVDELIKSKLGEPDVNETYKTEQREQVYQSQLNGKQTLNDVRNDNPTSHNVEPTVESKRINLLGNAIKRSRPKIFKPFLNGSGSGKYKCRYCPKSFKTISGLAEHARVHNRPHQCPNCREQFQHAPSLARHVRNRTCFTFTKYRCRVCAESFLEQVDWLEHIKIHAEDFPYQCQECLSQFKHKATLRRHVNTVHLLQY
ncbi:zinc finger protein 135-like [Topomyia yanbarensis]|uniref:zinc finger protein 135-like n=1 Tax=Topomyia yanbarensis TaxID=2498891 RepID=UPI00273BDBE6|nr:zinc finger protein 135-like [Topomyia yanbarensis]